MITTAQLKMDIGTPAVPAHISAKQGDTNSRCVMLSLYENGAPWTIPETASAVVRYQCLPDGSGGIYDTLADGSSAWSISGNEIQVILAPQMLAKAGGVLMDIALTDGSALLTTCNIHIHVEASPQEGTALRQADYFNLARVTTAYDALHQAIADAPITALAALPAAVHSWMEAHPEVTTTVRPGAVTPDKTSFIHYGTFQHPDTLVPDFVNQIPISTDADGYTLGWMTDTYLSTYTGNTTALTGYDTTGFIPVTGTGDILRMGGLRFYDNSYCRLAFYQADRTFIGTVTGLAISSDTAFAGGFTQDSSGNYISIDLTAYEAAQSVAVGFIRISAYALDDSAILTVNEEISYITVPGAVELIDLTLDKSIAVPRAEENADAIAALSERVAALEKQMGY